MPAATDKIPERVPFSVYGMLIILTFLFTTGAMWLLADDLSKHWHYFDKKEELPKKAVHITQINDNPDQFPDNFKLTDIDKEEYDLAWKSLYPKETPVPPDKDFEWPAGFDPLKYSIKYNVDNLHSDTDPERDKQSNILLKAAGVDVTAPVEKKDDAAPTPDKDKKEEPKKEEEKKP